MTSGGRGGSSPGHWCIYCCATGLIPSSNGELLQRLLGGEELMAWLDDSEPDKRDEQDVDEQKPTRLTAFYIALALVPVLVLFDYLGRFDLGLNIFICLFVNILAIRIRWKLREYPWFWRATAVVMAVELPAVALIRWPPYSGAPRYSCPSPSSPIWSLREPFNSQKSSSVNQRPLRGGKAGGPHLGALFLKEGVAGCRTSRF